MENIIYAAELAEITKHTREEREKSIKFSLQRYNQNKNREIERWFSNFSCEIEPMLLKGAENGFDGINVRFRPPQEIENEVRILVYEFLIDRKITVRENQIQGFLVSWKGPFRHGRISLCRNGHSVTWKYAVMYARLMGENRWHSITHFRDVTWPPNYMEVLERTAACTTPGKPATTPTAT